MVVIAEGLSARQQRHAEPAEFGQRGCHPSGGRPAVDRDIGFRQERSAHLGVLVAKHYPAPRPSGREGRRETGRPRAHDEDVAMGETVGVVVRVRQFRRHTEAGGAADHGLEELRPQGRALDEARTHEGLVVEPGREERRQQVVDRADVEAAGRPAVLARGHEPVVEFDLRGPQVRRHPGLVARHGDERVRLIGAGRQDAARAMVLERPSEEMHAVGEERRGQRVALETLVGMPVEGEAERRRAVDAAAAGRAEVDAHGATSSPAPIRGASPSGPGGAISGRGSPVL